MGDIQRQAEMAGLFDGSLSSCQAELQELMRQIDIMVNSKRLEWEASIQSTETQLRQREEEIKTTNMTLDLKTAETNRLTHELAGMERKQKELVTQYQQQVDQLHKELVTLQKNYEKLQRHHGKQNDSADKVKEESEVKLRKVRVDLRMAESKIEDHAAEAREWDVQRRAYKQQVEGLETQRQKLVEKCHALQQDCTTYKHQLGKCQKHFEQNDLDFRTRIVHVEGQLQRAQDTLDGKNSAIQRLEELLEEAGQRKKVAEDENRGLLEDVGRKGHQIHLLETEVSELQKELETKEGALHMTKKGLKEQTAKFENALMARESSLRTNEDESRLRSMQASEETSLLRAQLQDSQRRIQVLVESEARLKMELSRLENRLDTVQGENAALNVELTERIEELRKLDGQARLHHVSKKQKSQTDDGIERHLESELGGMRHEIESLTSALSQKNAMVNALSSKLSGSERQIREEMQGRERLQSELQIANAELEALRVENRSLRGQPPPTRLAPVPDAAGSRGSVPLLRSQPPPTRLAPGSSGGSHREMAEGQARDSDREKRREMPASAAAQQHHQAMIHALQSQLWEAQQKLKSANVDTTADPGMRIGPGLDGTRPDNIGPHIQSIHVSSRNIQSPARTKTSLDQVRDNSFGSPGRPRFGPSQAGPRSLQGSPVKPRPDPGISGVNGIGSNSNQVRNLPEGIEEWKQNAAEVDSDGMHSLETGSLGSGSCGSPLPSPPTFTSFLGDRLSLDDAEMSSADTTGLSDLGLGLDESRNQHLHRPPSRESVGTRFLREDQKHQAELERILNAHIHDLELRTTNTVSRHSQRNNQMDS